MKQKRYSIPHSKIAHVPILDRSRAIYPVKVKKTVAEANVFFREGISYLWGIAKNYKMYWGVTSSIIANVTPQIYP